VVIMTVLIAIWIAVAIAIFFHIDCHPAVAVVVSAAGAVAVVGAVHLVDRATPRCQN